jgi:hypothetical protein
LIIDFLERENPGGNGNFSTRAGEMSLAGADSKPREFMNERNDFLFSHEFLAERQCPLALTVPLGSGENRLRASIAAVVRGIH